ncbi:uncharacterized protein LOC110979825 isoform X2 [Acanthaster planci]|uniref:Uncharacterized protein LOC110979825 isoform X2 n=1 Tax=Acanthaster planci TaxID=133434 RepID=A0A8B7YEC8_ACAPL|nr:uncharacterized protein LOC110979825 isoform X2 [Acanthaster planci]
MYHSPFAMTSRARLSPYDEYIFLYGLPPILEESREKDDSSGSDSDGGTSADPPCLRTSLKYPPAARGSDVPLPEAELIASETTSQEYSVRKEEFSARIAALPTAETALDDQVAFGEIIGSDFGDASKYLDESVTSFPEDRRAVINRTIESVGGTQDGNDRTADYISPELDPGQDDKLQLGNDTCDSTLRLATGGRLEEVPCEQHVIDSGSDSNSDSYSSSSSNESMSTIRENIESCQLDSEDQNRLNEGNDLVQENDELWPTQEEHVYISPDLEFPFYKTTVAVEQTTNVTELLENLDKETFVRPSKPKEDKHSPRPISDDELENALRILRSGRPPQKRSWYSLDNLSTSKPNRAFALYYGERRNSSGDDNEPSSPEGNGTVFGLTATVKDKHRSYSAKEEVSGFKHFSIPSEPSGEDSVFLRPTSAPKDFSFPQDEDTRRGDKPNTPSTPSDEHCAEATPQYPPETIADDGLIMAKPVSLMDSSRQFPKLTNEHPASSVLEISPDDVYLHSIDNNKGNADSYTPESTLNEVPYQPKSEHTPYDSTISPSSQSREVGSFIDSTPTPEVPEAPVFVETSLPSPEPASEPKDEYALANPKFKPEQIALADPSELRPGSTSRPEHQSPNEWYSALPPPLEPRPGLAREWAQPTPPEMIPNVSQDVAVKFSSEYDFVITSEYPADEYDDLPPPPVVDDAYIPSEQSDDLPPPPDGVNVLRDPYNHEADDRIIAPGELPMFPEQNITTLVEQPEAFHPPSSQTHPRDADVEIEERPLMKEDHCPESSLEPNKSALRGNENVLPVNKTYPALPPKPSHLKQKTVLGKPVALPLVNEETTPVKSFSSDSNQPDEANQANFPMSPEPYISASVKFPIVYSMPPLGSPIALEPQLTCRGNIIDEQFPVFSQVQKEQALAEIATLIPKRKVPPKVPPKPAFKRKQKVDEPAFISTRISDVECSIDFSRLDKTDKSKEIPSKQGFVPESLRYEAPEEQHGPDESTGEDDVVIMQAGISVYREEPLESVKISDAGDQSYIPRDKTTLPHEALPEQPGYGIEKSPPNRSISRQTVKMSARLSLHRLETGEHFTETVVSVHEQDVMDEDNRNSSLDGEDVFVSASSTERNEVMDEVFGSERENGDGTFSTEDIYYPSDSLPEALETFPAGGPVGASYSDHFESPEFSSADEFLAEADMAMSKMVAASAQPLRDISSSSSTSSDDFSGSSDSDDSSSESAEEHTYIVTEPGDGLEGDYDNREPDVVSRPTTLPLVVEEGEEEEEEVESPGDREGDEQAEEEEAELVRPIETGLEDVKDDHSDEGMNQKDINYSEAEIPCEQAVTEYPKAISEEPVEVHNSELPSVTPIEIPRYPKYINYDRPPYDKKPVVEAQYNTVEQMYDVPEQIVQRSPPQSKSPDILETTIPDDEEQRSETSSESENSSASDTSGESASHTSCYDEEENGERECREETMEFSSEYSDEPEWQPPPPSTGARVFFLTSNMQFGFKAEPGHFQINQSPQHTEDEPPDTNLPSHYIQRSTDEEGDVVRDDDKRIEKEEEVKENKDGFEPDKHFRPITVVAPIVSEAEPEKHAKPIPQYRGEDKYDIPKSVTSVSESPPEISQDVALPAEQKNNAKGLKTVTVTYTVIHTKPHHDGTEEKEGCVSSDATMPGEISMDEKIMDNHHPREEEMREGRIEETPNAHRHLYQHALRDQHISEYDKSRQYSDSSPSGRYTESSIKDYSDEKIKPESVSLVESGPPPGRNEPVNQHRGSERLPSHETDLDKFESWYKSSPTVTESKDEGTETPSTKEARPEHRPDVVPDDANGYNSKSIPVNEVGPYNFDSYPDQERENLPDSSETTVKKIELRPEVALFTVSSREQIFPQTKPVDPKAATSPSSDDTEGTGSYRYSSWYEEKTDDTPAMAIALVKSDIKLPPEYLSERKTAEKPKPKPKPKPKEIPTVVNTSRSPDEKPEEGAYRYTSWYEEPREEKPKETDYVIVPSSAETQEESAPKQETPLSPEREPGTYKYMAWYDETADEPAGGDFFVVSRPTLDEEKSKSDSLNSPTSPARRPGSYLYSVWYDEPTNEPSQEEYFVVSAPESSEDTSKSSSSTARASDDIFKEGLSRSALYEKHQTTTKDPPETFVLSKPYEEPQLRPPDAGTQPTKSIGGDLYYPQEIDTGRNGRDPGGKSLSVEGGVSGASSRNNSYGSSRTSGSLADVSATSGEAMRRTWSDESDELHSSKDSSAFMPPAVQPVKQLPPKPKPRKGRPSAPSSSDDEQQQQLRRPGRSDKKGPETKTDVAETLTPRAEYAMASSAWERIPVEEPCHPPRESAIWDSGDDRRGQTRPAGRGGHDNRYSVPDKPRKEIEQMLDSLVADEDAFDLPRTHGREPQLPPKQLEDREATSRWRNDGAVSMNLLPQTQNKNYEFVETSLQESRSHSTSEPYIARGFDGKTVSGRHPDFAEPILALRPQGNEPSKMPETRPDESRGRRTVPRDDGPPSSRDEYRLAAASWENMSSASDEGPYKRTKMETWDNDPDPGSEQAAYPAALMVKQRHQPERAPSPAQANVRPRDLRRKGNGVIITADVHAPYIPPSVPGDPHLALQMLSASASTGELAPPPPKDWGTRRKAQSTLGISQHVPRRPEMEIVIPDAEASVPRRHHRSRVKGPQPPSAGPRPGRPHSPVSISSYSSTQSLPARILPRMPRENELEKLKKHMAEISRQTEIKKAELKKIHTRNPSVRHHIPMRGPRGELISADGRILSTPEAPNRAELEKYKRFFETLPEPHFRRLMHEMLEYKHMVKQKEEEIKRLNAQYAGLRRRLAQLAQQLR